jgi:hypothetical protein
VYISLVVVEVALIIKDSLVDQAQAVVVAVAEVAAQVLLVLLEQPTQAVVVVEVVMPQTAEQVARVSQSSVI